MEIARGATLLGFTATDTLAGLLLATKTTTKATLPGGHAVNLVTDARWELLPLDSSSSATNNPTTAAEEQEFWRSMQQHAIGGVHYFCETADLSRPFPSAHLPTEPELEFIWNAWLSQPLRDLGLPTHCPALMQGAVESVDEVHNRTGQRYTLCLLSRRSRRHPGTRYIARGLNEMAGPGNEIEAELLMWTPSAGSTNSGGGGGGSSSSNCVKWARVAWRRGTVPIWWGVELQPLNKGLQAEVYVKEQGTYVGMLSYIRTLQKRSKVDATGNCNGAGGGLGSRTRAEDEDKYESERNETAAKVTFINLLHCNPKKSAELMLSSHFEEGMAHVKARLAAEEKDKKKTTATGGVTSTTVPCQVAPPSLKKFDWHGVMAMLNEEQGIEAFWTFIEHPVKNTGLALGVMERRNTSHSARYHSSTFTSTDSDDKFNNEDGVSEDISLWGEQWQMKWKRRQNGVLRFNCADSLDRTNAATCFAMLPTLQEGLRLLGINLENTGVGAGTTVAPLGAGAALLASPSKGSFQAYGEKEEEEEEAEVEEIEEMKLPEGWEKREHAGRAVYIDHLNKVTQWKPPPGTTTSTTITKSTKVKFDGTSSTSSSTGIGDGTSTITAAAPEGISAPWMFFKYKLEDVRSKLYADSVADYVTMFKKHGDVHSALYTGSPAMHSHVLGLVLAADARPYGTSSSSVGKLQNLRVAVQRRWNNTVSDSARQQSMELFLGLNMGKYFPRVKSVVPPHPLAGIQSDLLGIDEDDTISEEEELGVGHVGAELKNLHLRKHDGRVGVKEEIANLEPLGGEGEVPSAAPLGAAAAAAQTEPVSFLIDAASPVAPDGPVVTSTTAIEAENNEVEVGLDEDGSEALDPLGAVRSPIKSTAEMSTPGNGAPTTQFSLI